MLNRSVPALAALALVVGSLALSTTHAAAEYRPYGPDQCRDGFVWREAFPGDHACVRPHVRAHAAADNAQALDRMYANGRCVDGLVWREAYPGDHVCVTPETRARAARDNFRAPHRVEP
jgi:hypothetical protein